MNAFGTTAQVATHSAASDCSARLALAALSLSMLLSSLGTSIANVALPTLATAFSATFQQAQWVVLAYLLSVTTMVVGVGKLADAVGRRRMLLAGVALFTAASVACSLAPSLPILVIARAVQGLGAASMMALTIAFVGETVPQEGIGRAMGLLGTMSAVGTAIGPALGGFLIAGFGWRALFLVSLPLGLAALYLAYRHLPGDPTNGNAGQSQFDVLGTFTLAATLASYAIAMTLGARHWGWQNFMLLMVAVAGALVFRRIEVQATAPLVDFRLLQSRVLREGSATSALVSTVVMSTLVVGPFYLAAAFSLSAAQIGVAMSCGPVVAALAGLPTGQVVDRYGAQAVVIAGLVAMAAGAAMLPLMPLSFGVAGYLTPLVVVTAGYAMFQAANNAGVMADAGAGQRGVVSGILTLSRNIGLITGTCVMGAVYIFASQTVGGTSDGPEPAMVGMRWTFTVATLLLATAIVIAVRGNRFRFPVDHSAKR